MPLTDEEIASLTPEQIDEAFKKSIIALAGSLPNTTKGNRPYYNQASAMELKITLDRLLLKREPQFIPLPPGYKKHTRRLQFSQASKYLLEHLDPDNKYKNLWPQLLVSHKGEGPVESRGTVIGFKRTANLVGFDVPDWRPELKKFLLTCETKDKFIREKIPLSELDKTFIRAEVEKMIAEGIPFYYDEKLDNNIKIIRL